MDLISVQIKMAMIAAGFHQTKIEQALSPVWTTDWITEKGKQQLKAYGIAPPVGKSIDNAYLEDLTIECPQCNSTNTTLVSAFGSTACKALFKCNDCKEPFDYFKCH
jgi:ring-1,2-phenylacetyl-CoA epoxidase subunit PaaD